MIVLDCSRVCLSYWLTTGEARHYSFASLNDFIVLRIYIIIVILSWVGLCGLLLFDRLVDIILI